MNSTPFSPNFIGISPITQCPPSWLQCVILTPLVTSWHSVVMQMPFLMMMITIFLTYMLFGMMKTVTSM